MNTLKSQKGFTLIELLLYVSISVVILLLSLAFMAELLHSRVKYQTIGEVEQQGLLVMQIITQTIRNAEAVTLPSQGEEGSTLTLNVVDSGSNPTVFDSSSGALRITEGDGDTIPLTNARVDASDLQFQNLSHSDTSGTVRIQFTLSHINPGGRNEYSYSKTFTGSATVRQP